MSISSEHYVNDQFWENHRNTLEFTGNHKICLFGQTTKQPLTWKSCTSNFEGLGLNLVACNVKKKVRVLSESTLCECHCIKELLAQNRCDTHLFFMRIKYFCLMIKTHDKIQVRFLSVHLFFQIPFCFKTFTFWF